AAGCTDSMENSGARLGDLDDREARVGAADVANQDDHAIASALPPPRRDWAADRSITQVPVRTSCAGTDPRSSGPSRARATAAALASPVAITSTCAERSITGGVMV